MRAHVAPGLGDVAGLRDDLEVLLAVEDHPQPAAHDAVVVGDHDLRHPLNLPSAVSRNRRVGRCGWIARPEPRVAHPQKETEMTLDNRSRRIVVGYDGSPASRAGLARAAERAGDDGKVYVVHAYTLPHDWIGTPDYQLLLDVVLDRAQECVKPLTKTSRGSTGRPRSSPTVPPRRSPAWPRPARRTRSSSAPAGRARPGAARQRRPRAHPSRRVPRDRDPGARRRARRGAREGPGGVVTATPARVVIAGGGVAALETLIALRELAATAWRSRWSRRTSPSATAR